MEVGDAVSVTGVTVGWGVAVTVNEVGVGGDALPTPFVAQPAASKAIPISSAAFITRRRGIVASPHIATAQERLTPKTACPLRGQYTASHAV